MKKAIAVILSVALIVSILSGCGTKLYYNYNMAKYVSVDSYSNVVNRNSSAYIDALNNYYKETFGTNLNYEATEGIVEYGDIVNITYEGYVGGKTFLYGTGVNYELEIGSGYFTVDGFEDGLIGAKIGETITLKLKLPSNFANSGVAGKKVRFEVTVNFAIKRAAPTEEIAKEYGFLSLADYREKADKYAVGVCIFHKMSDKTTIIKYPEKEFGILFDDAYKSFAKLCAENGTSVSNYLSSHNLTKEDLIEDIEENEVKPVIDVYLLSYYIIENNNKKLTVRHIEDKREQLIKKYGENLAEQGFNEINIQQAAAYDMAIELLFDTAKIKN